jgi:hypothetical protein
MAATVTTTGTAGYVDITRGLPEAPASPAASDALITAYTLAANRSRFITELYHFTDIGDTETHAFAIAGVKMVFSAGALASGNNPVDVRLTSALGTVTFQSESAANAAYVLLFIDPVVAGRQGVRGL